ncbi:MAG TPA: OmpW family protein [Leeuwenhoekiella sp.]|nr:OmpW family protein [Leeuwenhoekiella sp.]
MKKITLFLVFALASFAVSAQDTKLGFTAGYLNAEVKVSADGDGSFSASESGFYLGALADIDLNGALHLQPEVLYSNVNDGSVLYIPVLFKYYISESGFNLMAGPQATIDLEEAEEGYNSLGVDASFGIGYDINENFFIDARYSLEVTNRIGDLPGLPDNISGKINSLQIGVGYKF